MLKETSNDVEESDFDDEDIVEWLDNDTDFVAHYLDHLSEKRIRQLGVHKIHEDLFSCHSEHLEGNWKVTKQKVQQMNETDMFVELVKDLGSDLDFDVVCYKLLHNVSILTDSDRSSLFLTRGTNEEKYLYLKLNVTRTSTFEESLTTEESGVKVPFGTGIAGTVAANKTTINISEAYDDSRFCKDMDNKTGYRTHSILCMPILDYTGECIGVAQIINKHSGPPHEFDERDEALFSRYLIFCGIELKNALLFDMSVRENQRKNLLLNLARNIFTEQRDKEELVKKIMMDVPKITLCERLKVYLTEHFEETFEGSEFFGEFESMKEYHDVEEVLFSRIFVLCHVNTSYEVKSLSSTDLSQCPCMRVAKEVVVSKEIVNISCTELDCDRGIDIDGSQEFLAKNVLCMPIFDSRGHVMGVTQQLNKISEMDFDTRDENIMEAFSVYIGLGLQYCALYQHVCRLTAMQKLAFDALSYHATAQPEETESLLNAEIPKSKELAIYSFDFDDLLLDNFMLAKVTIRMFLEMDILEIFTIPYEVLCRWIMSVKKNYRPVAYHNWRHAFNVSQACFAMLYTGGLNKLFDDLEMFCLIVACLCHDLDHRGTNNAFQIEIESSLSNLYTTSVLEHHHFDQCVMILNSLGNNIFSSLSSEEYRTALGYIEHTILATDLAMYFQKRKDFEELLNTNTNFMELRAKNLLKAMMMTACDLAGMCKSWKVTFRTAMLVSKEFYEQGDLELSQLGLKPIALMDRTKKDEMPQLQVGFFDAVCLPLYSLFTKYDTRLKPMYDGCKRNRQQWQKLVGIEKEKFRIYCARRQHEDELKRNGKWNLLYSLHLLCL